MARKSSSDRESARARYFITGEAWHSREAEISEETESAIVTAADLETSEREIEYTPVVAADMADAAEAILDEEPITEDVEYSTDFVSGGAELTEELSEIENAITEIVAEVEQKISDAEEKLAEIESEIETVEAEETEPGEREETQDRLDYLYQRLYEIEGEIEEYPEDLLELEQEFESIREELVNLRQDHLEVTEANLPELLETMTAQEILDAWGIPVEVKGIYRGETPFLDDVLQFMVDIGGASEYFSYTPTEGGYAIWELSQTA